LIDSLSQIQYFPNQIVHIPARPVKTHPDRPVEENWNSRHIPHVFLQYLELFSKRFVHFPLDFCNEQELFSHQGGGSTSWQAGVGPGVGDDVGDAVFGSASPQRPQVFLQ